MIRKLLADPRFAERVAEGATSRELGAEFGCHHSTAARARKVLDGEHHRRDVAERSGEVVIKGDGPHLQVSAAGNHLVRNVDDLCVVGEIDMEEWQISAHKVKTWTTSIKGPDDLPRITRHWA